MVRSSDKCRAVADSNVILAAQQSTHAQSPNREIIERWRLGEFDLLYSADTLAEYAEKLLALDVARGDVVEFLAHVISLGQAVEIRFFHLPSYPHDPDDIAFLLCAWNGLASHLVSYDGDLLTLADDYRSHFHICRPLEFLAAVRNGRE
jgi:predicted nucleic acid-binding protein